MFELKVDKKGVALFMVLATILIVVVLANVVLNIAASQSRLTHHEVSRIQAYYAAQAGMVYALEKLRNGTWNSGSCPVNTCYVTDSGFAPYIVNNRVEVVFCPAASTCKTVFCSPPPLSGINFCVQSFAEYTYSP